MVVGCLAALLLRLLVQAVVVEAALQPESQTIPGRTAGR